MKYHFLATLVALFSLANSTSRNLSWLSLVFSFLFKNQKNENNNEKKQVKLEVDPGLEIKPSTPNVRDLILNGAFKEGKDRSPLWRNYDDRNLTRPAFVSDL